MKGVGTVVGMGMVYWFCYFLAIGLTMAAVGLVILAVMGVVGLAYYLMFIFRALRQRNAGGAILLLAAPALLTGGSYLYVVAYEHGAWFFPNFMAGSDNWGIFEFLAIPIGLYAMVGWLLPLWLAYQFGVGELADEPMDVMEGLVGVLFLAIVSLPWVFVGGGAWAGMAMGLPGFN